MVIEITEPLQLPPGVLLPMTMVFAQRKQVLALRISFLVYSSWTHVELTPVSTDVPLALKQAAFVVQHDMTRCLNRWLASQIPPRPAPKSLLDKAEAWKVHLFRNGTVTVWLHTKQKHGLKFTGRWKKARVYRRKHEASPAA